MTRIADYAASNALLGYMLDTQSRVQDLETQISTEKKSQTYSGIAQDSQHLVNIENTRAMLNQYIGNNNIEDLRLGVAGDTIDSVSQSISDFRDVLSSFEESTTKTQADVANIQDWAFRTLQTVQGYLNTQADGRYVFSGSRITTQPVDLGLTTLADFQAKYDGSTVTYPTTADAQLANFSMSEDSTGATNWLYFQQDDGTGVSSITATTAQFANVAPGTTITVSGTGSNDGTYTVASVSADGKTIDVVTKQLTDEANQAAATLTTADGTVLDTSDFGDLSFTRATNTITAATAGSLSGIAVGSSITIGGTANNNDGTYTVVSNDGTNIVIQAKHLTDEGTALPGGQVSGTISATSYYKGDDQAITHRVDDRRSIDNDVTAADPAFEKAIRALSIVAQGQYGTTGGLDQNLGRVGDALYLLDSSLNTPTSSLAPYGQESSSNMDSVQQKIAFNRVLINQMNTSHQNFMTTLDNEAGRVEDVDQTQAITQLLNESQALDASYQAIARIRQLSLGNYLSS